MVLHSASRQYDMPALSNKVFGFDGRPIVLCIEFGFSLGDGLLSGQLRCRRPNRSCSETKLATESLIFKVLQLTGFDKAVAVSDNLTTHQRNVRDSVASFDTVLPHQISH